MTVTVPACPVASIRSLVATAPHDGDPTVSLVPNHQPPRTTLHGHRHAVDRPAPIPVRLDGVADPRERRHADDAGLLQRFATAARPAADHGVVVARKLDGGACAPTNSSTPSVSLPTPRSPLTSAVPAVSASRSHDRSPATALDDASTSAFGAPARTFGEGGSIPFMGMLGEKFPEAQFVNTGVLGPDATPTARTSTSTCRPPVASPWPWRTSSGRTPLAEPTTERHTVPGQT
jgi:hypothetical protein